MNYKGWSIQKWCNPIPDRRWDWGAVHSDYDGAPDSGDIRAFATFSLSDAKEQIDNWDIEHG